mmetsp:Transcript_14551/g.10486  ORF Transcript_14551/g.10486 Transcript_14551/m.10486 type:complete len:80 (-) Transcript_14551:164-403(-)
MKQKDYFDMYNATCQELESLREQYEAMIEVVKFPLNTPDSSMSFKLTSMRDQLDKNYSFGKVSSLRNSLLCGSTSAPIS